MVSANFPEKGAQARRKVDGLLGEIYAVDPSKDLLTVRWRTATGFLTQVCTSEHFARDWELTATTFNLPRVPLTSPEALTRQLDLERQRYLLRAGGLLFICAIVLFIVYSILTPSSKTVQPNNNSQTPAPVGDLYSIAVPPGAIKLTADQLSTAYNIKSKEVFTNAKAKAAAAAADALYKGKTLLVSGWVSGSVGEDPSGTPKGSFYAETNTGLFIDISFRPSEKSKLANLTEGDSITVLCRVHANADFAPALTNCLLQSHVPGTTPAILTDQIKATLVSNGEKLKDCKYSERLLDCHINTGELFLSPAGLRADLSGPLRDLYALAYKYPQIRRINVYLETPAAPQKDEYGHDLPAHTFNWVIFAIDAEDFRNFSKDFDWDSYPVYVVNRYDPNVQWSVNDTWKSELRDEIRQGGFQGH
jgi:hypothetical protein